MTSTIFFFIFIPLLACLLLLINVLFSINKPYSEKNSVFECGYHSFLGQNRTQFNISFFIFALLFLLFDLEILLVYPFTVSAGVNDAYGLVVMLIFFMILTLGFSFELGKDALNISSRQNIRKTEKKNTKVIGKKSVNFNLGNLGRRCFSTSSVLFLDSRNVDVHPNSTYNQSPIRENDIEDSPEELIERYRNNPTQLVDDKKVKLDILCEKVKLFMLDTYNDRAREKENIDPAHWGIFDRETAKWLREENHKTHCDMEHIDRNWARALVAIENLAVPSETSDDGLEQATEIDSNTEFWADLTDTIAEHGDTVRNNLDSFTQDLIHRLNIYDVDGVSSDSQDDSSDDNNDDDSSDSNSESNKSNQSNESNQNNQSNENNPDSSVASSSKNKRKREESDLEDVSNKRRCVESDIQNLNIQSSSKNKRKGYQSDSENVSTSEGKKLKTNNNQDNIREEISDKQQPSWLDDLD